MNQYLSLLNDIKQNGIEKSDRTNTGTKSVFGRQFRHDLSLGFPLLTTKKLHTKSIIYELLWFIGCHTKDEKYSNLFKTNTKYLEDNGVTIWKEWTTESGDIGKGYGFQYTNWETLRGNSINQIDEVINQLKHNPDSRRIMVSAWNVGELQNMALPPCHYGYQLYSNEMSNNERISKFVSHCELYNIEINTDINSMMTELNYPTRKLSLMWNQRSVDTFLGLPFNIASYALLTYMYAMVTNHEVGELIGNLGDTHLYLNHLEYVDKQIERIPRELPLLKINRKIVDIYDFKFEDFEFIDYKPYPNWKNVPIAV